MLREHLGRLILGQINQSSFQGEYIRERQYLKLVFIQKHTTVGRKGHHSPRTHDDQNYRVSPHIIGVPMAHRLCHIADLSMCLFVVSLRFVKS